VVAGVGKNVTEFRVGDDVYGSGNGSFAEYVAASTKKLATMPANLSYERAAAVPVSGVSALQALRNKGRCRAGEKVLVVGASGGVGSFAVQLAKAYGAVVTGVASTTKIDFVRSLGADVVIDYLREDFADGSERYDVIIDTGGNSRLSDLRQVLAPEGRLVTVGGESKARWIWPTAGRQLRSLFISPFTHQKLRSLLAIENAKDLAALSEMIESQKITPAIDRTFALSDTASAIHYVIDGHARGKVVVHVAPTITSASDGNEVSQ
jgi:NADPH:quinone reductase-like Zn-dependent oxidoreductase